MNSLYALLPAIPAPRDLPLPLPIPEFVLHLLVVPSFLVHLLFVNLTVGAALMSVVFEFLGLSNPRYDRLARTISQSITVNKSMAVVLGIAPLLMLNLLYTTQFYAANALTGHAWVMLIPLVTTAFLLSYLHQYTWARWSGARKPRHLVTGLAAALSFLAIPLIFLSNINLMLLPEHWNEVGNFFESLQFGNVFPRYFHFLAASLALTGLFLAARFGWRTFPVEERLPGFTKPELIRHFYGWAFACSVLQGVFGPLVFLTLKWNGITPAMLGALMLALAAAIPVYWMLAREMRSERPVIGWRYASIVVCLSLTVLGMGAGRHFYREGALAPQKALIADRTIDFYGIEEGTQMRLKAGLSAGESTLGPRTGKVVYDQICSACHQLDNAVNAPSLKEIYSLYHDNPSGIVAWAKAPGKKRAQFNAMPSMGHLDAEELVRVAGYMLQTGGGTVAAKPAPAPAAAKP